LVPNNSQDRTYIYDFSKDESVKTINWHQLVCVFPMFHTSYTIQPHVINLMLSTSRYQPHVIKQRSSQKNHRDKSKRCQSTKILKYDSIKVLKY
jgi:hypothetical protein